MIFLHDERCLEYGQAGHPENPERLQRAVEFLRHQPGYRFQTPDPASDADVHRVHSENHLEQLRSGIFLSPDNPSYAGIEGYATLSAGAAIQAAELQGFSLMRPPGHHAADGRIAGFCYLNNLAIAVRSTGARTLIVDIDGHHGDGTQMVFQDDPQVTFVSLHSSPNFPGTGFKSRGNCHNYPLPFDCGEARYLQTLDEALSAVDLDGVKQVAVSAGFDTDERDPLASLGLAIDSYRKIGERIAALALPTFAVLEGGYDPERLGPDIDAFCRGLSGDASEGEV
ncbi:MAG: histone deacetylase family protein [Candidatus Bipolaricaulia bacterium]